MRINNRFGPFISASSVNFRLSQSVIVILKAGLGDIMGNGEWGMVNGEWGVGNGEWGVGSHCCPVKVPVNK